jgi:tetratricopeptide (TPR) repeat protein
LDYERRGVASLKGKDLKSTKMNPLKSIDAYQQARAFESQGEFTRAAEAYKRALELGVGDPADAYQRRGRALARIGRYEEALHACQRALALDPNLHLAHGVSGHSYFKLGKYDLAEQEFRTAIRLQPDDLIALQSLTRLYFEQGRREETIRMLERTLDYRTQDLRLWVALADLHRAQSHLSEVSKRLQKTPGLGFTFRIQFYAALFLTRVLQFFEKLNPAVRLVINVTIYGIALFAPHFLSIPLGLILSVFGLLFIGIYPRIYTYEGNERKIALLFLLYVLNCVIYWGIVFLAPLG